MNGVYDGTIEVVPCHFSHYDEVRSEPAMTAWVKRKGQLMVEVPDCVM